MAWIKRNLFFVVGGLLALGLLGAAGYYNYRGWSHNTQAFNSLNDIYTTLQNLADQKPSPGNDKVNNTQTAKEQTRELQEWIQKTSQYFQPVAPIPNTGTNAVTSEAFAASLRRMVDQLQREADDASVILPPQYGFSFEAQRRLVRFSGNLGALAQQLGEVKAIAEIMFAAKVNSLDGIQRVRVSDDDLNGPQTDYTDELPVTNQLAVLTPYQITFRSFTPEIAEVLAGFASSPHGFIVKSITVLPAGAYAAAAPDSMSPGGVPGAMPGMMPGGVPPPGAPPAAPMYAPGRGGLQTVLNEQLLRITLVVDVVKLLPRK